MLGQGPLNPLALCAWNAFWQMSTIEILKFADLQGIAIPGSSSLFGVLLKTVAGILKVTEERAMDTIKLRICVDSNSQSFSDVLLSCDDAVELKDHNDKEAVGLEMKGAVHKQDELENFTD